MGTGRISSPLSAGFIAELPAGTQQALQGADALPVRPGGQVQAGVEALPVDKDVAGPALASGHLCRCTGYENILRAVKKTMLRRLEKA